MSQDKLNHDHVQALKRYVVWLRNSIDSLMEEPGNRAKIAELKRYLAAALRCLSDKDVMKKYFEHLKQMRPKVQRGKNAQR